MGRRGIKLSHFFAVTAGALALLLALLFALLLDGSQRAVRATGDQLRAAASRKAIRLVGDYLEEADRAVAEIERWAERGVLDPADLASVEAHLFAGMLSHPRLAAMTFTWGRRAAGTTGEDEPVLADDGRGQLSVLRVSVPGQSGERMVTRWVHRDGGRWVEDVRDRPSGGTLAGAGFHRNDAAHLDDPTTHPTFATPARRSFAGRPLWSDLSFSEADAALPEALRHKVVTVQKALRDAGADLVGVVRAALIADQLDDLTQQRVNEDDPADEHRLFLTDRHGRLSCSRSTASHSSAASSPTCR